VCATELQARFRNPLRALPTRRDDAQSILLYLSSL
jgi:hypothetical protein